MCLRGRPARRALRAYILSPAPRARNLLNVLTHVIAACVTLKLEATAMIGRPFKILTETFCVMVKTNLHHNGGPGLTGLARRRRDRQTNR